MAAAVLALLACSLVPCRVLADGGAVVGVARSGPHTLTVFAAPQPLRAPLMDLSALVQTGGRPRLDCTVQFSARRGETVRQAQGVRDSATNKLLHHAWLSVPDGGLWQLLTEARCDASVITAVAQLTLGPPEPALSTYWPYFALPFVTIGLMLVRRRLLVARRRTRPE